MHTMITDTLPFQILELREKRFLDARGSYGYHEHLSKSRFTRVSDVSLAGATKF